MIKAEQRKIVWMELYLAAVKCCEEDHLGSTTLITNKSGEVVQRVEYLPTGETFIEQQDTSWVSPHKFNGRLALRDVFETTWRKKELDEETGLYYYGARYYDPRLSMWHGTDPMQEKYPGISTYAFCHLNPIKIIDINGKDTVNLLPPPNIDSRTYALMMDINHFNDDPNVIN